MTKGIIDKEKNNYYITTPIYYPSGDWHIGHCYTTVNCDILARFNRLKGKEVYFLTGTDEHGFKIQKAANELGVNEQDLVDKRAKSLAALFDRLKISNDIFYRTTSEKHKSAVSKIFEYLYQKGDIYKGKYEGLYCMPCESYWTKKQAVSNLCPDCGREVQQKKEEAYFFKLTKYQNKVLELYKNSPEFLQPLIRQNEMVGSFLGDKLEDLCVSRSGLEWGVRVPFDDNQTVYVWIDALSNYITALGYQPGENSAELFKKFWPANVHMVGKEIVRFHAIVWPAILMALDVELPKQIFGHGWLLLNGEKMSKSKGNVIEPNALIDTYGTDAVRHFLSAEFVFGSDGHYTGNSFISRTNTDLVNTLGNLVKRTFAMNRQYFEGIVSKGSEETDEDKQFISHIDSLVSIVEKHLDKMEIDKASASIIELCRKANKYIDITTPWILAKDTANKERLGTVLYVILEAVRVVAVLLQAFLPDTAEKIFAQFVNIDAECKKLVNAKYGVLKNGTQTQEADVLFARIKETE